MNPSKAIGKFAASFASEGLTPDLRYSCARSLLDTFAVGIAGRKEPATLRALAYLPALGVKSAATLWGMGRRVPVEAAALCNGISAHVLDYDDVTSPLRGHPSVALWPALLALAEERELALDRTLSAFCVGFEVMCKLAKAIATEHYARGWHATSTIGIIGATAACAHLLQLDEQASSHAIGLAVAQAAGTRANFGSDAKSFQAGHANAAAIRAACLAQAGFTSSPDSLDAALGYSALYGQGHDLYPALATLGAGRLELNESGIDVKKYPLCYATHRTLDGLLDMRQAHGLTLEAVDRVEVRTSAGALVPLIHHRPTTGLQAKFSMEYAAAAALKDGRVNLASFTDNAVNRPDIQAFLPKVTASSVEQANILPRWAEVRVFMRDGRQLEQRVEVLRGSAAQPLTDQEIIEKAHDCYAWGGMRGDPGKQLQVACIKASKLSDFFALVHPV
jgi:2-methylcitrate dehydratase PrpD